RPTFTAAAAAPVGIEPHIPDPRHELARLALDVVVRTAEPVDLPRRWLGTPFAREVDRTRAQLAPIRSRQALIASFSREASIAVTRGECSGPADRTGPTASPGTAADPVQPPGPVRVAYAIRWLELGDGRRRPPWESFVAGPVELVSGALVARDDQRNGEINR
ncbi:MAG: hypothetical protein M3Q66_05335, partial [Chloroflexota bacterium]|nr:hypothetical protein [Chloroflexota bacterium]